MQDFISKGNGDSRYLKSVSNFMELYPTYEDFVQALVEGTLPIDFNGYNPNGISQRGTPYNKASVLTDETAALLGLSGNPTPNDAFAALAGGVGGDVFMQIGNYAGDGQVTQSPPYPDFYVDGTAFMIFVVCRTNNDWLISCNSNYGGQYRSVPRFGVINNANITSGDLAVFSNNSYRISDPSHYYLRCDRVGSSPSEQMNISGYAYDYMILYKKD